MRYEKQRNKKINMEQNRHQDTRKKVYEQIQENMLQFYLWR